MSEFKTTIEQNIADCKKNAEAKGKAAWVHSNNPGLKEAYSSQEQSLLDAALRLEKIRDLANEDDMIQDTASKRYKATSFNPEEAVANSSFIEGAEWFQSKLKNLL